MTNEEFEKIIDILHAHFKEAEKRVPYFFDEAVEILEDYKSNSGRFDAAEEGKDLAGSPKNRTGFLTIFALLMARDFAEQAGDEEAEAIGREFKAVKTEMDALKDFLVEKMNGRKNMEAEIGDIFAVAAEDVKAPPAPVKLPPKPAREKPKPARKPRHKPRGPA